MVRKLGELPKFLVVNSGTNSLGNRSVFAFYLLLFAFIQISIFSCRAIDMGLVTFCYVYLSDGAEPLPPLPKVLYGALIHLGYDGDAPVYRCRLSMAHSLERCEVSVTIPFDPTEPWSRSVIGSKPDTSIEMMAHIALTSLCEDRHATTAALPIALLPILNLENTVWQQRLEDNLVGQVCVVHVQPSAQHRQHRHIVAYASDGIRGECHRHRSRD
jgi:hypothetical protein